MNVYYFSSSIFLYCFIAVNFTTYVFNIIVYLQMIFYYFMYRSLMIFHFSPPDLCAISVIHFISIYVVNPSIHCYYFDLNNDLFKTFLNGKNVLYICEYIFTYLPFFMLFISLYRSRFLLCYLPFPKELP